jgi:hypothetical protein
VTYLQDTERRQLLLKDEYLHIQKTVVELDGRAITIKAWTVSFSLAALIGAFVAHKAAILLVSAFSASLFFVIEGFWKHNQQAFYFRSELIERYFAGHLEQLEPFQIDRHWVQFDRDRRLRDYLKAMLRPHVYLPHAPIIALAVVLYVLARLGWVHV